MGRDAAATLAALIMGVFIPSCAAPQATAPPPPEREHLDVARVTVTLERSPEGDQQDRKACQAQADKKPARVWTDGVVIWTIKNKCKVLKHQEGLAAFELANFRVDGANEEKGATEMKPTLSFEGCSLQLDSVESEDSSGVDRKPKRTVIVCLVPQDAEPGTYKYDVQGAEIELLDPDIEIRPRP